MEGLRAERDEQDRFNSRAKKAKKNVVASRDVPPPKGNGALVFVILLLVTLGGAGVWGYISLQVKIDAMEKELAIAAKHISRSTLLMARFEGELNEADAEAQESGSLVSKKLAFLDAEMRKLWGVSNDRNKKAIKANEKALLALGGDIKTTGDSLKGLVDENKKALGTDISKLNEQVVQLASMAQVASSEISVTREALNEDLNALSRAVQKQADVGKSVEDNRQAIASIDASRLQLNERIVKLESQLSKLSLSLGGGKSNVNGDINVVVE